MDESVHTSGGAVTPSDGPTASRASQPSADATIAAPHDSPAWGSQREMNALETLMWRAESNPRMRSTVCGLELLDRAPDWERLVAAHEWASRLVPRFRQRVIEAPLGLGAPRGSSTATSILGTTCAG